MSIQNLYPNISPTLSLDFASVKALDSRVTFTRASTATYYGTQTAKAEENLLLQSQDFTTTWTNTRSTDSANTTAAPDGTTTADSVLQQAGQTTSGAVQQTITSVVGDYAVSIFAKPNGKNFLVIREVLLDGTSNDTWFDVQNGTVGTTDAGHTATITASTNSYYRCSIKFTANAARVGNIVFFIADTNGSLTVADDGNGLYFWGAQVEQRSAVTAYTPTTTQPITNYIPVLQTAAAGVARFDHNPITGESLGLLIEEQRTNLLTYSEQFDNAAWTAGNATVESNTIVAPNGTLTGDKIVEDTSTNFHGIVAASGNRPTLSGNHTFSVFIKNGGRRYVVFAVVTGTAGFMATVDTQNWAITEATNASGGGTYVGSSLTPVGNGWYRLSITGGGATDAVTLVRGSLNATGNTGVAPSYTGDGYSGIYIWGAQLEAGAFPTSYIPTVASQVTRSADAASMTGANFSSWYRADRGTLYADFMRPNTNTIGQEFRVFALDSIDIDVFNAAVQFKVLSDTNVNINAGSLTANAVTKAAGAYKVNDFAASLNGATAVTDTSGTLVEATAAYIGNRPAGSRNINGTIKKLAFYPERLSDAQLQALTS